MWQLGGGVRTRERSTVSILTEKISLMPLFLLATSPVGNRFGYCTLSLSFKHPACDLLEGTMEETDEGLGACIDFFLLLFYLNASHFPRPLLLNTFPSPSTIINLSIHAGWKIAPITYGMWYTEMALVPLTNMRRNILRWLTRLQDECNAAYNAIKYWKLLYSTPKVKVGGMDVHYK